MKASKARRRKLASQKGAATRRLALVAILATATQDIIRDSLPHSCLHRRATGQCIAHDEVGEED